MNFCSERSKMRLQIEMVHLSMVSNWKPSRSSWGTGKFHWYMSCGSMMHNLKGFSVSCACSHGMTNQHLREARSSLQRPSSQQGETLTIIGLVSVLRRLPWTVPLLPHYQLHLTCYFSFVPYYFSNLLLQYLCTCYFLCRSRTFLSFMSLLRRYIYIIYISCYVQRINIRHMQGKKRKRIVNAPKLKN